ncbi:MAG TPA: (2Fe-2S)-binding protein [Verrucomicrobiae bacterium]|nr:(2Fe-2S)-binding protein [Verrucomicrobiae bacterium]
MPEPIAFTLNDKPVRLAADPERPLLWVLRTDFGLTGTKFGCGEGHCGSCAVLVNNVASRSCLLQLKHVAGKDVVTIEGLAKNGALHPLQKAFMAHDAFQCGFCTCGMVITGAAFLRTHPRPTREQIVRGLEENFCRCGAHQRIIAAMQTAAEQIAIANR